MSQIDPYKVGGVRVPIEVDSYGTFRAFWDGQEYSADSRQKLGGLLDSAAKQTKVRVSIPFHTIHDQTIKAGVATGIHATNGTILARIGERGVQLRAYETFLDMEEPEVPALQALIKAMSDARSAYDQFLKDHRMPLEALVKEALSEAIQAGS